MPSQFILCKPFQEKQENKFKVFQALCIQIPPVKYCSVCQTRKYLDTGKQRSVPFIQQKWCPIYFSYFLFIFFTPICLSFSQRCLTQKPITFQKLQRLPIVDDHFAKRESKILLTVSIFLRTQRLTGAYSSKKRASGKKICWNF